MLIAPRFRHEPFEFLVLWREGIGLPSLRRRWQAVEITSTAAGYAADHASLTVTDDDVLTLNFTLARGSVSEGAGAAVYKGRLVDIASIRQAEVIVRMSDMFAG